MKVLVGMWLEPDEEHRTCSWATRNKWPMQVKEIRERGSFTLEGATGLWNTTGLRVFNDFCLENK